MSFLTTIVARTCFFAFAYSSLSFRFERPNVRGVRMFTTSSFRSCHVVNLDEFITKCSFKDDPSAWQLQRIPMRMFGLSVSPAFCSHGCIDCLKNSSFAGMSQVGGCQKLQQVLSNWSARVCWSASPKHASLLPVQSFG